MKRLAVFLCIIALTFSIIGKANALLVEIDRYTPGDALITLDTTTGFEWLDVTETMNMSYEQVWANAQLGAEGWRHATNFEVTDLFDRYLTLQNVGEIQGYFGITHYFDSTQPDADFWMTHGFITYIGGRSPYGNAFIKRMRGDRLIWEARDFSRWNTNQAEPYVGHWLIRQASTPTPVPEPSTMLLLSLGLIGILGLKRKSKSG